MTFARIARKASGVGRKAERAKMKKKQYKKNLRRLNTLVTGQTYWHLCRKAAAAGYSEKELGRIIDKMSRTEQAEEAERKKHGYY